MKKKCNPRGRKFLCIDQKSKVDLMIAFYKIHKINCDCATPPKKTNLNLKICKRIYKPPSQDLTFLKFFSQIKEQSYHCQWLCHHKSTLVGRNCLFIFSENIDYYQTQGPLHNGSFIFLREFLKKLCYTLTTNLTGLIETKSSGSDYISLYHVQSTLISKSKFHRLVSKTD